MAMITSPHGMEVTHIGYGQDGVSEYKIACTMDWWMANGKATVGWYEYQHNKCRISDVEIVDRTPVLIHQNGGNNYSWVEAKRLGLIPPAINQALRDIYWKGPAVCSTSKEAKDQLGQACLLWARDHNSHAAPTPAKEEAARRDSLHVYYGDDFANAFITAVRREDRVCQLGNYDTKDEDIQYLSAKLEVLKHKLTVEENKVLTMATDIVIRRMRGITLTEGQFMDKWLASLPQGIRLQLAQQFDVIKCECGQPKCEGWKLIYRHT